MIRWIEISACIALALFVHVIAFAKSNDPGVQSGGSGGEAVVSIQAAAATVTEMVAAWERPTPDLTQTPNTLAQPAPVSDTAPFVPQVAPPPTPRAANVPAIVPPDEFEPVDIDTTPPPPPEPELVVEETPEPEAKKEAKKPEPEEGQRAKEASAGRKKEVAAGTGGDAQAGQGRADVSAGDNAQNARLQVAWGARIRSQIERNKRYPRGTRETGSVTIVLQVSRNGKLLSYRIRKSSNNPILDEAAVSTVARSRRFPKAPKDLSGNSFTFSVKLTLSP